MRKDLRDTAVQAAAARYGAEHYRGILFLSSLAKWWPAGIVVALVAGLAWLGTHTSAVTRVSAGLSVAGIAMVVLLIWLTIRHLTSPYRRRRWRR